MKNRSNKPSKTPQKAPAAAKPPPSEAQIRARAHEIFLKRGGTPGHALEDWVTAERELRSSAR